MTSPILVALDLDSAEEAVRLAAALEPAVGGFKIGLELLMGPGPGTIGALYASESRSLSTPNSTTFHRQLSEPPGNWVWPEHAG